MRRRLEVLYDQIDARARTVSATQAEWPCRRGCDHCCRSLADVPRVTRAEWTLLTEAIGALSPETRAVVDAAMRALQSSHAAGEPRHGVTCPLLDSVSGACRVYAHRPAACRTYGFYVDREAGLWCADIEDRWNARGSSESVVFGNQHAVDRELEAISGEPARSLLAWWPPR